MAHWAQLEYVRQVWTSFPEFFKNRRVLEVGSGDIRGSVRKHFEDCEYLGVDVAEGPGVDRVCSGHELKEAPESFDVVVSCECFEHNPFWQETFVNMVRMLRPGGLCLVSCASLGRREHGTRRTSPAASLATLAQGESAHGLEQYTDYYGNLRARDFERAIDFEQLFERYLLRENIFRRDLYFVGFKKQEGKESVDPTRFERMQAAVSNIRKKTSMGWFGVTRSYVKHHATAVFVDLFGEQRLHDLRYRIRHGSKKAHAAPGREEKAPNTD